jgi:hypothetical protein
LKNYQAADTSQRRNASEVPRDDVKDKSVGIRETLKKRHSMHITPDPINSSNNNISYPIVNQPNHHGAIKEETVEEDKDDDVVRIHSLN